MGELRAAARVLDHIDREVRNDLMPGETREDREAWFYFDRISEVSSFTTGKAGLLSQIRFFIGVEGPDGIPIPARDPRTGNVLPGLDAGAVTDCEDTLRRYTDAGGGHSSIFEAQAQVWDVVGDGYLIGYPINAAGEPVEDEDPSKVAEEFRFVAKGAIAKKDVGGGYRLHETRTTTIDLPSSTIVRRMTRSHPRYPGEGKGWVKQALDPCRDLFFFELAQRAAAKSNLPADVWIVPAEASPKEVNPKGWGPGDEGALTDGGGPNMAAQSESMAAYMERMLGQFVGSAMTEVNAGNGVLPAFLSIEERLIEKFNKLSFARPIDAQLKEGIDQARLRLAESADGQPEDMTGQDGISRWNGAKLDADRYRRYLKPTADAMADQWTTVVLHPDMRARRRDERTYSMLRICVDASPIVTPPDKAQAATEGIRMGAIGFSYWREAHGIPDTAAPTEEDFAIMERLRLSPDAHYATGTGRGDTGPPDSTTQPAASAYRPVHAGLTIALPSVTASASRRLGDALLSIEYAALARLEAAAELALDEGVRKAGAKLRNWAKSSGMNEQLPVAIQRIELADVVPTLGHARCLTLAEAQYGDPEQRQEDLFAAALVALLATFERVIRQAYDQAQREYGASVPPAEISANIEKAKAALRAGMLLVAEREVFGHPDADDAEGEHVLGLRVPTSVLRAALAIAGGFYLAMSLRPSPALAETPVVNGTISTASLVFGPTLATIAPSASSLRWAYGSEYRTEPFEPHVALDGKRFATQTDPVLAGSPFSVGAGFYVPGDHTGCRCYAVPDSTEE